MKSGTTIKTEQYNEICKNTYKRVFTDLPKTSPLEKLAHKNFYNFLNTYNQDVFNTNNNILDIFEIGANLYEIDPYEKYSIERLLDLIMKEYKKTIQNDEYIKIMSMKEIKKSLTSYKEIKSIISAYDKKELTAYIVYLLLKDKMNMTQKNQILAITSIWPECLCTAIVIINEKYFRNN